MSRVGLVDNIRRSRLKILILFGISSMVILLCFQCVYCANFDLYIFSSDNDEEILIKIQSFAGENIQIILKEDVIKDSNIKIYKPVMENELWDYWKFSIFLDLAKISESKNNQKNSTDENDYVTFYRFIKLIKDKIGSEYSSIIQFADEQINITAYNINNMLESEPSEDIIRRLCIFGYGVDNANYDFLLKKSKEGATSVVIPLPFKEIFANSVRQFAKNVKKPIHISLYTVVVLILSLAVICLVIFIFREGKKSKKIRRENARLLRNLANIQHQSQSISEKAKDIKDIADNPQTESYYLDLFFNVILDIYKFLNNQITITRTDESIKKIELLLESISSKVNGNWVDVAKKRLFEIVKGALKTDSSELNISKPKSIDEFQKIDWSKEFMPIVDKLTTCVKSGNEPSQESKQLLAEIGRDVIAPIVIAIDREKGNIDPSVEDGLKELMTITGIKELDVKLGQVYNHALHELVVINDPSLVTDRDQRISKIISRGLILPDGNIIKAKVSIQN